MTAFPLRTIQNLRVHKLPLPHEHLKRKNMINKMKSANIKLHIGTRSNYRVLGTDLLEVIQTEAIGKSCHIYKIGT